MPPFFFFFLLFRFVLFFPPISPIMASIFTLQLLKQQMNQWMNRLMARGFFLFHSSSIRPDQRDKRPLETTRCVGLTLPAPSRALKRKDYNTNRAWINPLSATQSLKSILRLEMVNGATSPIIITYIVCKTLKVFALNLFSMFLQYTNVMHTRYVHFQWYFLVL